MFTFNYKTIAMKAFNFIIACLFSLTCFGQTKLISFRSHSGNVVNFRSAVEQNLFDIGNSNFGIAIRHIEKVDSVIRKNNNEIIILIKSYNIAHPFGPKQYNKTYHKDIISKVQFPELFSATSVDGLKSAISNVYIRRNESVTLDSALFIGFDKQTRQKGKSSKK